MSFLIPISSYSLALQPFNPVPALNVEFPVTVRLTMAALDLEAVDDKEEPSTVRVLKRTRALSAAEKYSDRDEFDGLDPEDYGNIQEIVEKAVAKKEISSKKAQDEEDHRDSNSNSNDYDYDDDDDDDDEIEEFVLCTLSPKVQFQQILDITIFPSDEIHFVVTGSYPVHLSGNFVENATDEDSDNDDSDELNDEYYEDADEGNENDNSTPDEDELIDITVLNKILGAEGKIKEIVEKDNKVKDKKNKKRSADDVEESKTSKKAREDKKKVQFTKELEQGPANQKKGVQDAKNSTKNAKVDVKKEKFEPKGDSKESKCTKFKTSTLLGGVITEDRKTGSGSAAKSGNKVGIRYIGKLKNGKVFDKNTSGKPFVFNLGKGECIKGFDLGVTGMAVGGERRVIIPSRMGYGSQALPGIPANSELTFDIKLVSLK